MNEFNTKFIDNKGLSFLHLNIRSLKKHFENLNCLINDSKKQLDIIALSETRIERNNSHSNQLKNYSFESNGTESTAGGTGIYVSNTLNYIPRHDLSSYMYVPKELESTFIELKLNNSNMIIACIYKHPGFNSNTFITNYLSVILNKINKESKQIVLLGDFNINLLNYENSEDVKFFVDTVQSFSIFPTISKPTRITNNSETLIDNILLSSNTKKTYFSGNLSIGISDHLPQFLILNETKYNTNKNHTIYKDWNRFNYGEFKESFRRIDWNESLKLEDKNPNRSFDIFYDLLNKLTHQNLPTKKITHNQIKKEHKPCV